MKKTAILCLVLVVALGLCACRMRQNEETTPAPTTEPNTEPPTDTTPEPTIVDPTIIDPTIAPNIPDSGVDNDHLVDPTEGNGATEDGDGLIPDIRSRLT